MKLRKICQYDVIILIKMQNAVVRKNRTLNFKNRQFSIEKRENFEMIPALSILKMKLCTKLQVPQRPLVKFFIVWFSKLLRIYFKNY